MEPLSQRNTATVQQTLADMNARLYKMQEQNQVLHASVANLTERLNHLDQRVMIQKVQLTGLGPSVRE